MVELLVFLRLSYTVPLLIAVGRLASALETTVPTLFPIFTTATPNVSECGGGVTTLGACSSMVSTLSQCDVATGQSAQLDCFCNQDVFNLFYGCENEANLCLESPALDYFYELEVQSWHSACDSLVTFSVTTPLVSSLSQTVNLEACGQIYQYCISGDMGRSSCASTATATINLLSCMCQPSMTYLYSACLFNANVSCYGVPGNTAGIIGHSFCSQFQTATESLQASEVSSALASFGFTTWTPAAAEASASLVLNTITSKPPIPISMAGTTPTSSQSAGSDKLVVSRLFLLISLLPVSLLLTAFS